MDTRLNNRIPTPGKIEIRIAESSQKIVSLKSGNNFEADLIDVSVSGMSFISLYFIPKRVNVISELDAKLFDSEGKVSIEGQIAYCRQEKDIEGYKCGVKFGELSRETFDILTKYIESRSS